MIELILSDSFPEKLAEKLRPKFLYVMQTFLSSIELKITPSNHKVKVRIVYGLCNQHSTSLDDIPTVYIPASLVGLEDMCKPGTWPIPELIQLRGNQVKIPYIAGHQKGEEDIDLIASIFFFLSLQHEIQLQLDNYDELRLPYSKTWFAKHDFWPKIPIVSLLFQCLAYRINQTLENDLLPIHLIYPQGKKFAIGLSHDIDFIPYGYWSSLRRVIKNTANLALLNKRFLPAGIVFFNFIKLLAKRKLPLNNIAPLLQKEASVNIKSSFEIFSKTIPHRKDPNYNIEDKPVQAIMRMIVENGHEVNLHGSYTSCTKEGRLANEAHSLRRYVGSVSGNRQHCLNLTVPRFHIELEKAAIIYDMSLAYPEVIGYRTGLDKPHFLWNIEKNCKTHVLNIPFLFFDTTLHEYLNLSVSSIYREVDYWLDNIHKWGSAVSLLWHDSQFDGLHYPGMEKVYWYLVKRASSMGALLTNPGTISEFFLERWEDSSKRLFWENT